MQYFPLFVDTQSLRVLIVGAGEVASRKLDLLARTEANIKVIAPVVCDEVRHYAQQGRITLIERQVMVEDLDKLDLLYMATADDELNRTMAIHAKAHGLWVNVVDAPSLCRFITPSIVDRGRLQVAISTAGAAPVFARELRSRLETWLAPSLSELFDFIAERRVDVQQRLPIFSQRKLFWEQFFNANGDRYDAETQLHYDNSFNNLASMGEIILIDDETPVQLLPIAAMPLLQRLDLLCSDTPLPTSLLELARRDASRSAVLSLSQITEHYQQGDRLLIYASPEQVKQLVAHFPMAKHIKAGSL
ncbi:bifunctional precorrin-2 dehydrogenase/sirohydrochlorin ferrochelatase [Shewanella colwelliana]|uniref:precorrin-2 dehydrogenase/sirohydrochlorin ferrochelatase family protein n=1 Tax=Shewanella colwelliana TaxID=23 RepID=UPI0022AE7994|nr:bifunctional precorrin-2 dehydrogenase/sirohydrochlorin ferrochelatase [Shewanella colwelliana]MCZ4337102.1 bifunctional precorrin-2 dehydrogenase/sirohydrochlorin ferrochelatase [Shewanella colwelliana]